jgi:hypothetical protein
MSTEDYIGMRGREHQRNDRGSAAVGDLVGAGVGEHVRLHDLHRFLGDLAVEDPVGTQLMGLRVP